MDLKVAVNYTLASFINSASPEEKERVYNKVMYDTQIVIEETIYEATEQRERGHSTSR